MMFHKTIQFEKIHKTIINIANIAYLLGKRIINNSNKLKNLIANVSLYSFPKSYCTKKNSYYLLRIQGLIN